MRKCEHGLEVGKFCASCAAEKPKGQAPAYCYSRDEVVALNPIRKAQGLPPLKEGDSWLQ